MGQLHSNQIQKLSNEQFVASCLSNLQFFHTASTKFNQISLALEKKGYPKSLSTFTVFWKALR